MAVSYQDYLKGTPGAQPTAPQFTPGKKPTANPFTPLSQQPWIHPTQHGGGGGIAPRPVAPQTQQTDPFQEWMQQQYAAQQSPVMMANVMGKVGHSDGTPPSLGPVGWGGTGGQPGMMGMPGMLPPPLPERFNGQFPHMRPGGQRPTPGGQSPIPLNQQMQLYNQSVEQNKRFDAAEKLRIEAGKKERERLQNQLLQTGPYYPKRPTSNPYLPQVTYAQR